MKNFIYILAVVVLSVLFVQCKKVGNVKPVAQSYSSDYDSTNNIFRVKASSSDVAFTVSITTTNPAKAGVTEVQNGNQNAGDPFEYPFTPAIGDSIKVVAQSNSGSVYLYPLYKGILLPGVVTQTKSGGGQIATFSYLVTH